MCFRSLVMEYQLATSEEFQVLKKRLLSEVKRLYKTLDQDHSPIYRRLMEKKIQLICDTIETVGRNPGMQMFEVCAQIEDRIDAQEREIDDARTFEEKENIYHSINAYEWIHGVVKSVLRKYKI
jgi:hypothetical protein